MSKEFKAPTSCRLEVTAENIQESIDCQGWDDGKNCAVAMALKHAFGLTEHGYRRIRGQTASFNKDGVRYQYIFPATVLPKMICYDKAHTMQPFTTMLQLWDQKPVAFKPTQARRDQINKARRIRVAKNKAAGVPPKVYGRYATVAA